MDTRQANDMALMIDAAKDAKDALYDFIKSGEVHRANTIRLAVTAQALGPRRATT